MTATFKVGVVGAGNMGSGIAQKMAQEGFQVILVDVKDEFVQRGMESIRKTLQEGLERKVFTQAQVDSTLLRVKGTTSLEDLTDADLVVEAVFEDIDVKGQLFQRLDTICHSKTIFATNTSSFFVHKIAKYTNRPDRFIGMHYFYHPAKNRLLEIVPHEGTSKETLEKVLLIGKLHGKTNIVVADTPGFAVNRFFVVFLNESVRILEEEIANIPTIESATKKAFSIGMGPFELMNVTGIPIAVHASTTLGNEIGPFYATAELLKQQMNLKTNWDLSGEVDETKIDAVVNRLYGATLGVAAELVEQGVASIEDTDRGAKIGLRWRYGPFELMNKVGVEKVYENALALLEHNPDFKVSKLLEKQAKSGQPFEFNFVDLEIKENIAYITINRPEAMNAINPDVVAQLENRFDEAENNPQVKAIAIQGAGKAFIAGADIKFFINNITNNTLNKTVEFTLKGHELLLRLENSHKLTIAVLDGLSLGGGSELALACQKIVATPAGSLGFPETGIGIYPGLGGMIRMERHVGPELTKYYVFTGKTLKAAEAYQLGIVSLLTEPANIDSAIRELAFAERVNKYRDREIPETFADRKAICSVSNVQRLLEGIQVTDIDEKFAEQTAKILAVKAPIALSMVNELINAQSKVTIEEAITLELNRLIEIFSTEDALTGLQSPPGKPPKYKGKLKSRI
ncbi:3-hydroxyacyl-CoA dehydrogenase NAD-binding domain-containing protein [Neobacillus sp. 3P2-tot-E-2]|uniref:3-hydroxyacyl-CoA dehydrogenase/enoyl-CoA hydratase family protein n=1 Tax=Neobacillus sp. 3P2-tot-E-2 TaxID=3132212 RepID=UPI0039A1AD6D